MRRRIIVDSMSEDKTLAELGVVANLVFDRLVTMTDDAGLCPGEPVIIKGKAFPMMDEMTIEKIGTAVDVLCSAKMLYRLDHRGRSVLAMKPDSFQSIQKLRKDYKRSFDFGDLSQVVWRQGLPGIVRDPIGIVASVSVTVTGNTCRNPNGAADASQEEPEQSNPNLDRARKEHEAHQFAVNWLSANRPQYLKKNQIETFGRAVFAWGKDRAVRELGEVLADSSVEYPFAVLSKRIEDDGRQQQVVKAKTPSRTVKFS